ncbi:tetratricopeptide repeat protein [bacterium]|nr:tetratricopeptide repeat protein [bacterium]
MKLMSKAKIEEETEQDSYELEGHETRRWAAVGVLGVLVVAAVLFAVFLAGPILQGKSARFVKFKQNAAAFIADGEYAEAISMYQRALTLEPNDLGIRELMARCRLQSGDLTEAIADYRRYLRKKPDDTQTQLTLASLYLLAKDADRSRETIDAILVNEPDNFPALAMEAQCYYEIKSSSNPALDLSMITSILPAADSPYNLPEGSVSVGASAVEETELLKAVSDTSPAGAPNTDKVRARKSLADFYRRQKRFTEAEREYKKMIEIVPRDPNVYLHLADFYRGEEISRLPEAIEQYSYILRSIDPKNLFALRPIGGLSIATGDLAEAKKYVDRLLWEHPSEPYGRYFRGILEIYNEEMESAEEDFLFATRELSEHAHPHYLLGYTHLLNHAMGKAKKSLQQAGRVDPTYGPPRLLLAEIALNRDEYKQALETVDELLSVEKQKVNPLVYLLQGRIYIAQDDPVRAEAPFTELATLDAESIYPKLLMGEVYKRTRKNDEAAARYQAAIAADPDSARPSYLLGLLYEKMNEPVLSMRHYEKAVEKDPNLAIAARKLSEAYYRSSGESEADARKLGETFLDRFPNNLTLLDTLGMVFYDKEEFDKAVDVLELISEQKRDARPQIVYHYAMALYGSAKRAQAQADRASGKKAREAAQKAARRNAHARREFEKAARWLRNLPIAEDLEKTFDGFSRKTRISG